MDFSGSGTGDFVSSQGWSSGMMSNFTTLLLVNNTATTAPQDALTCEQRQYEFGFPLPLTTNVANVLRYMQVAYYLMCLPFGFFLNLFVTVLIAHTKKLQNATFILALQVCASDMINAAIVFPTSAANAIADRYVFTGFCTTIGFALFFLRIVRIYLMLVLVLDRFCSVFMPFWYQRNKIKVIVPLSLGAWIWSFTITIIPVRGILDCYSFSRSTWACVPISGCRNPNACSIYISSSIALSNFCNVIGLVLYSILFYKAKKIQNKIAVAPQPDTESTCTEERKAAAERLKRERRANITFLLLFLALVGVGLPPFIFFVIGRPLVSSLNIVPHPAYTVIQVIGRAFYPLITIMDPIVIMRNQDFRAAMRNFLKRFKTPQASESNGYNTSYTSASIQ
jgi:predicted nucleic acid-binding Zn ribbon protein